MQNVIIENTFFVFEMKNVLKYIVSYFINLILLDIG